MVPARTIDDYYLCPYRGLLTALRSPAALDPVKAGIGKEDSLEGWEPPDDIIVASAGNRSVSATICLDQGCIAVRGVPDLVAIWDRLPMIPVVVEIARTPISGPRSVAHVIGRALFYSLALTLCTGQTHVPVIVSSSSWTRHHGLIPEPRRAPLERALSAVLEALETGEMLPRRPGPHCAHCLHRRSCPVGLGVSAG